MTPAENKPLESHDPDSHQKVLRVLKMHLQVLREAGASNDFIQAYANILDHLKHLSPSDLEGDERLSLRRVRKSQELPSEEAIVSTPLDELERMVESDSSTRKLLELIAVARFKVPKGSMRSFSNIGLLRDRILTHIRNERTHQTIAAVARDHK